MSAQFILNQEGEAFGLLPFFNDSIISGQHIKTIEGFYTYKKGKIVAVNSKVYGVRFFGKSQTLYSKALMWFKKGWNEIMVKVPCTTKHQNWMFTFVPINSEGLRFSYTKN